MTNTWGLYVRRVWLRSAYRSTHPCLRSGPRVPTTSACRWTTKVSGSSSNPARPTQVGQSVIIEGQSGEQVTQFIWFRSRRVPTDPVAKVVLTELFPAGFPPSNFPFNQVLPGWEIDNTVIRFFNIGAATYSENQYNVKQPGTQQDTMYWIEETTP